MRLRRLVFFVLCTVALVYVGICGVLWMLQDRMVFPGAGRGDRGVPAPAAVVATVGEAGARTRIATLAAQNRKAVVVYFGGNGEDLYAAVGAAMDLVGYGVEVIAVEPPGYGASEGTPSVPSLLATARAVAVFGKARAAALRVPFVVVGSSLGSFSAVHIAAAGGVDKLVLRAPPSNLVAVAKSNFWWLPVGLLLAHRFDNLGAAKDVRCPVLVLHGNVDTIVPDRFGRELAAALPQATFVSVPGCGHNDLDLSPAGPVAKALRTFLGL
jgi:pimeloyl-ACP methyl ester carboxylesterase